jgi:phosphatidate cytidylyltransferase
MSNFQKRFLISLTAFPLIYLLLFIPLAFNFLIFIVFFTCVYEWTKVFKKKDFLYFAGIIIFLIFLLLSLKIYNLKSYNLNFLWLILIAWLTDIGGYVFGKIIGGPKLTKISPNKTWSGAFGSFVLSQFAFLIFFSEPSYTFGVNVFIIQLSLSFIGQIGDLLMSYIKRKNSIKDSSRLIPGHGGFLERLDGLIWIIIFGSILFI